jgi:hypothetical protein
LELFLITLDYKTQSQINQTQPSSIIYPHEIIIDYPRSQEIIPEKLKATIPFGIIFDYLGYQKSIPDYANTPIPYPLSLDHPCLAKQSKIKQMRISPIGLFLIIHD